MPCSATRPTTAACEFAKDSCYELLDAEAASLDAREAAIREAERRGRRMAGRR
jgi:hypothetical protein